MNADKKNYLLQSERHGYYLTISESFIAGMVEVPVRHFRLDRPPKLKNFFFAKMFPLAIKFSGEGLPVAGEIYRVFIENEASHGFRDQNNQYCRSRDRLVVKIYLHDHANCPKLSGGELGFSVCGKNEQAEVWPAPKFFQSIHGLEKNGYLWISDPGVEYKARRLDQVDEEIFSGNVINYLNPEKVIPGAVSIQLEVDGKKISVYDRRKYRDSQLAHATQVRRTLGRGRLAHTFEFVTLREADSEAGASHILSEDGIVAIVDEV